MFLNDSTHAKAVSRWDSQPVLRLTESILLIEDAVLVMASELKKRELFKGALRPPKYQSSSESYTQKPASQEEVSAVKKGKGDSVVAMEFDSRAIPQPFLDPSVIQQRLQAEKQWAIDQKKKRLHDGEAST